MSQQFNGKIELDVRDSGERYVDHEAEVRGWFIKD